MKTSIRSLLLLCCSGPLLAQQPAAEFDRGASLQAWQDPGYPAALAECREPPTPFRLGGAVADGEPPPAPPAPALPTVDGIPGIVADGARWRVVWSWQGNNADGPIAGEDGSLLFANNDADNVMRLDPETGLAEILYRNTNTGGALSRSKSGELFLAMRGLGSGVLQLEPERRVFADRIDGESFDCVGGVVNDLAADAKGGVYLAVTGAGVFHADPEGAISRQGEAPVANGIVLSPDEAVLYVTNGPELLAFDVRSDGSLAGRRVLAPLSGGGDGSAVDERGNIYVATGASVDVISPAGETLGVIPGPRGIHGVAFGGEDKRTLFGIVFYGTWGTPAARNQVVALPLLSRGYSGRAK